MAYEFCLRELPLFVCGYIFQTQIPCCRATPIIRLPYCGFILLAPMSVFKKNKNSKVLVWKPPYLILGPYEQFYPFQGAYASDWLTEKKFSYGVGALGGNRKENLRDRQFQ